MSQKVCNFAPAFDENVSAKLKKNRDLAQLVAHTSGGREVAGSSPVIPTKRKEADNRKVRASLFLMYSEELFVPLSYDEQESMVVYRLNVPDTPKSEPQQQNLWKDGDPF